jgi:WD40 repeat protein
MNEINEKKDNTILDVSFNQDNSCFAIGTENGFKIYQTYPFKGPHVRNMNGGIGRAEMLYKSNFLALIGGGKIPKYNNNKAVIWDDHEKKVISELKFITPVINVKLKKDLIFIICHKRIYVFNFNTYDIIETLDTCDNKKGLISINNAPDFTVVVYPGLKENKVTINDFKQKKTQTIIAQDDKVSYMAINYNGTLLATSNEKGNFIRIHSCSDGTFLKEFKRGTGKVDYIYICFDNNNKFMAVSSNKGTIHIFSMGSTIKKLKEVEKNENKDKKKADKKNEPENEIKDENEIDKKNELKNEIKDEKEVNFF